MVAVRIFWWAWLLMKLAGAMLHGSLQFAIAPQGFPAGGLVFSSSRAGECGFAKAGLGLIPLLERADGNLLLQERSRSGRGETTLTKFALRGQQTIRCRSTHGKQLPSALIRDVKVLMPLQRLYQGREKWDESFGADPVGGVPDQEQRVLDFWSIAAKTWVPTRLLHLLGMVEEPPRVFTHISGGCYKGLKQRPFLGRRCLAVLRSHLVEHFPLDLIIQRIFHSPLLWKRASGDLFTEATGDSPVCPLKNLPLSLTNAMFFYCSRADERSSGLGGKTRANSWENVCLKRRKEDFREAMRLLKAGGYELRAL